MAVIYYPSSAALYSRQVNPGLTELTIATTPNTVFVFTSSLAFTSSITAASASYVQYGRSMVLCSAYTPLSNGPDTAEVTVPFSPSDGITAVPWNVKRLSLRTQTSESISSSIYFEKSIGNGVFSASYVGGVFLSGSLYESYNTSESFGQVSSGNKLRFNVIQLGTATNWTVIAELSN